MMITLKVGVQYIATFSFCVQFPTISHGYNQTINNQICKFRKKKLQYEFCADWYLLIDTFRIAMLCTNANWYTSGLQNKFVDFSFAIFDCSFENVGNTIIILTLPDLLELASMFDQTLQLIPLTPLLVFHLQHSLSSSQYYFHIQFLKKHKYLIFSIVNNLKAINKIK